VRRYQNPDDHRSEKTREGADGRCRRITTDIALSYAGEDRNRAKELAFALKRRGTRVFYDKDEAVRLWGENLFTHLTDLYQNRARYCVALLSKHHAGKPWTRRELAAAQARALGQKEPYLLPLRLDDTSIPGVLPTEAFVPWSGDSSDTMAELVLERLKGEQAPPAPTRRQLDRLDWRELRSDYLSRSTLQTRLTTNPRLSRPCKPVSGSRMTTEFGTPRSATAHIGLRIGRSMEQSGTAIGVSQTANWASHPFL
jgi:hypothetical protein